MAGVLDRETKQVKAVKVKDVKRSTLNRIINTNVEFGARVYTDEWIGYQGISQRFNHSVVLHGHGQYVQGEVHTNTLEGFWALLKRGIVGQYHKVSIKHLNSYIDEFCFRYNNCHNESVFELTLQRAVGAK